MNHSDSSEFNESMIWRGPTMLEFATILQSVLGQFSTCTVFQHIKDGDVYLHPQEFIE